MIPLLIASIMLVLVGILIRFYAKQQAGGFVLSDQILYMDTAGSAVDLLVSDRYQLIGRPDYILEERGERVPVERKSRMLTHSGPHEGERLQLAAYCLLVEERWGRPVHHGRLQYQNTSLDVPFDEALRRKVLATLGAIQSCVDVGNVRRSHPSPARCLGCGFRTDCAESLAR